MFRKTALVSAVSVLAASAVDPPNKHDRAFYLIQFHDWLSEHQLSPESGDEFVHMLQNFANNHDIIEKHNSEGHPYTLGHNEFSHLSLDEFRQYMKLGLDRPQEKSLASSLHAAPIDKSGLPGSVDWRAAGAVTEVKNQGQCGSW